MARLLTRLYELSGTARLSAYLRALRRRDAVFIWIPKTAGTSIADAAGAVKVKSRHLMKYRFVNRGIVTFGHMDYAALVAAGRVSPAFNARAFKFAFSRNPYDRAVSLFAYFRRQGKIAADTSFSAFWRCIADKGCDPVGIYNVRGFSQCNPQVRWIEKVTLDFVGAYENLEADAARLMARLGLPGTAVPHLNPTRHDDYRRYYDGRSRTVVREWFAEDFAFFGYPDTLIDNV